MIIKVCGLREADNIRAVAELPVDMLGFDFRPQSERFVRMISSRAGIIPDYSEQRWKNPDSRSWPAGKKTVGVFADDMPQNIITRIYNYRLDAVQLDGDETAVMIANLRRSVVPDIAPAVTVIKTLRVSEAADLLRWRDFQGAADLLRLELKREDMALLDCYDGELPFLLSCGLTADDAELVGRLRHPRLAGIDLNEGFESAPAVKDAALLRHFLGRLSR